MRQEIDQLTGQYLVRKTKKQKEAFRSWLVPLLEDAGYPVAVETGGSGVKNVVAGNPETAKLLLSAHYDTQANMVIPNFLTPGNLLIVALYQIVLAALMFAAAGLVTFLVSLVVPNFFVVMLVWVLSLFGILLLLMVGPANKNTYNDNTSGVASLLEIALTLPEEHRNDAAFLFFDLEELGMLGSRAFVKAHPKAAKKPLFNFDCVGDGEHIVFMPSKKLRKDIAFRNRLAAALPSGEVIWDIPKKYLFYPFDQMGFQNGVGVAAFRKAPFLGYYVGRIHTSRDTVMEPRNIEAIAEAMSAYIASGIPD